MAVSLSKVQHLAITSVPGDGGEAKSTLWGTLGGHFGLLYARIHADPRDNPIYGMPKTGYISGNAGHLGRPGGVERSVSAVTRADSVVRAPVHTAFRRM